MKVDIAIIPYRKISFAERYGATVRDLMMLEALSASDMVRQVHWLERPSVLPELLRISGSRYRPGEKVQIHRKIDPGIIGPLLKGRLRSVSSFRMHERFLRSWLATERPGEMKVILDFHPLYRPPRDILTRAVYWYDLIDNFEKHHAFSSAERAAVREKYSLAAASANLTTGVSVSALRGFPNHLVLGNRIPRGRSPDLSLEECHYDFGFTGFVTSKFDVPFAKRLSALGFRLLVQGEVYDKEVARELASIPNLTLKGRYHASEQATIISQFTVGLIPYVPELCHDESPIKLLQYLAAGRGALLSRRFTDVEQEFQDWVGYYADMSDDEIRRFVAQAKTHSFRRRLLSAAAASPAIYWDRCLEQLIQQHFIESGKMEGESSALSRRL